MMNNTFGFALSSLFTFNRARNSRRTAAFLLPVLFLSALFAAAQTAHLTNPTANAVSFGTVNVGASKAATLTFTFTNPGTGVTVQALTLGAKNGDFTDAGTGSCTTNGVAHNYAANDTCTVNVALKPTFNGPRNGTVQLVGTGGQIVGSGYVYGTGYGPQIVYPGGAQSAVNVSNGPNGVAVDGAGNLYFSTIGLNDVEEYVMATGTVKVLATGFSFPAGVAVDGAGNVYVADIYNNAVKEIMAVDGTVVTLGTGFVTPNAVAVDGAGNVYVADSGNDSIKEILAADGSVHALGGNFPFDNPVGVAVDTTGNVYAVSLYDGTAFEIPAGGGTVKTIGSGFNLPRGVTVDGIGNVYVADTYNNAVKIISATDGSIRSIGTGLNTPDGVLVDAAGNIYIADYNNNRIVIENEATAPVLTFATPTTVESLDAADGPQSVSIENIGSAPLTLSPATGANPTLTTSFSLASGTTTCASLNNASTGTALLASNATCAYAVNFTPAADGPIQGKLTITDNNGTAFGTGTNASQIILLNGMGVGTVTINVTGTLPPATVGTSYTGSFSASGGLAPYSFTATGLPPGLTLSTSGALTGIPTKAGTYTIVVTATDADSFTGSASFTLTVVPAPVTITITGTLPAGTVGASYSGSFAAAGGSAPYSFTATGVPPGLTLSTTGTLTGIPTTAGIYTVVVTARDANAATGSASFTITVTAAATVTITVTGTLPAGTVGTSYTGSFAAAGGSAPYSFTATGVPAGLTLSTAGGLTGTPTTAGSYTVVVTAKDANGATGSATFTLTVSAGTTTPTGDFQLTLANTGTQLITAGSAAQYNLTVTPTGGSFPFPVSFTVSGLPAGYSNIFSPATVTPGTSAVQTQLTVRTNLTFTSVQKSNPYGIVLAFLMLPLFGLRKLRRNLGRSLLAVLLLCGSLAATVGLTGCVGNHVNPATYNVVITATGNKAQHSVTTVLQVHP